jgi:hypothetical protein
MVILALPIGVDGIGLPAETVAVGGGMVGLFGGVVGEPTCVGTRVGPFLVASLHALTNKSDARDAMKMKGRGDLIVLLGAT